MRKIARWLAAAPGLALVTTPGFAGPMGRSYTTTVTALVNSADPEIYLGVYSFSDGTTLQTVQRWAPVPAGVSGSGQGPTTAPVVIAETPRFAGGLREDGPEQRSVSPLVEIPLILTDSGSGGTFGASFSALYEYDPVSADDTSSPLRLILNPNDAPRPGRPSGMDPRVPGDNRYEISFGETVDTDETTGLGIGIGVTSLIAEPAPPGAPGAPADAPEPATLALAALGLGALALRRVR